MAEQDRAPEAPARADWSAISASIAYPFTGAPAVIIPAAAWSMAWLARHVAPTRAGIVAGAIALLVALGALAPVVRCAWPAEVSATGSARAARARELAGDVVRAQGALAVAIGPALAAALAPTARYAEWAVLELAGRLFSLDVPAQVREDWLVLAALAWALGFAPAAVGALVRPAAVRRGVLASLALAARTVAEAPVAYFVLLVAIGFVTMLASSVGTVLGRLTVSAPATSEIRWFVLVYSAVIAARMVGAWSALTRRRS